MSGMNAIAPDHTPWPNLVLVKAVPIRRCPGALLVNPTLGKCVDLDCHCEVGKLYMLCFPACPDSLEI